MTLILNLLFLMERTANFAMLISGLELNHSSASRAKLPVPEGNVDWRYPYQRLMHFKRGYIRGQSSRPWDAKKAYGGITRPEAGLYRIRFLSIFQTSGVLR